MKVILAIKNKLSPRTRRLARSVVDPLELYGKFAVRCALGRYRRRSPKRYPRTLQLPVTYHCNFDCVMCGMRKMAGRPGFTPDELRKILRDKLFCKIRSVGLNGGEPFLLDNLEEYVLALLDELPGMKALFIISNGYYTERILNKAPRIAALCHARNVSVHISISLDGYGDTQDVMRGKDGAFEHAVATLRAILQDRETYCDGIGAICTVTKVNVYRLAELDSWAEDRGIPMSYNIASFHKRIENKEKYKNFSVLTDEHARLMAAEFFYSRFLKTRGEDDFALYYYLRFHERISLCDHRLNAVTLTPDGGISYCATYSDELGNALTDSARKIYFRGANQAYRKNLHRQYCGICSHYTDMLGVKGYLLYARERIRETSFFG